MNILYSHRTRSADGQRVHIDALTSALSARGHEVFIAAPDGGALQLGAGGNNVAKAMLPGALYELAEYGYSWPAFRRLDAAAAAHKPDILYERYNLFFHAGAWLKRKRNLPFLLEVNAPLAAERAQHGGLALKKFAARSEREIWRAADKVLPVSNVLADIVREAGVPDNKIEVVHNGVDASFLTIADPGQVRARYALQDKIVLGFSGFVREWHGVDRVIRFIAAEARPDLHLLIVGDGPARAKLEALARDLNVASQVTVTGVVQREAMPGHVAAFDIALQPASVAYASPLKLFEYMAQAKAVLAPSQANIRAVVRPGADALLFDADGFESALRALLADSDLRARLGASARQSLIARGFTWADNAAKVERIAEALMSRRS